MFSPPVWGWGVHRARFLALLGVFPTRVGMGLGYERDQENPQVFPTQAGIGLENNRARVVFYTFSPRSGWG